MDALEQLNQDALAERQERALLPQPAIQKLSYSHEAMIDLIVQRPDISQGEIAAAFGYTQAWVSRIIASDAFQSQLASRREEIIDPAIKATVEERFKALVIRSLDVLQEKLSMPSHQVPDNLALRAVELSSKALGYGAKPEPPPVQPQADSLTILGERLVNLLDSKRRILDGKEIVEGQIAQASSQGPGPDPA